MRMLGGNGSGGGGRSRNVDEPTHPDEDFNQGETDDVPF